MTNFGIEKAGLKMWGISKKEVAMKCKQFEVHNFKFWMTEILNSKLLDEMQKFAKKDL